MMLSPAISQDRAIEVTLTSASSLKRGDTKSYPVRGKTERPLRLYICLAEDNHGVPPLRRCMPLYTYKASIYPIARQILVFLIYTIFTC